MSATLDEEEFALADFRGKGHIAILPASTLGGGAPAEPRFPDRLFRRINNVAGYISTDAASAADDAAATAADRIVVAADKVTTEGYRDEAETFRDQAQSAAAAANNNTTSTSSHDISTGSKTFTLASPIINLAGFVVIAETATPSNYLYGQVTAKSGNDITVNVTATNGSGTAITAWTVAGGAGAQGAAGLDGAQLDVVNTFTADQIFEGNIEVNNASPQIAITESDRAANQRRWRWMSAAGDLYLQAVSDGGGLWSTAMIVYRSAGNVDYIETAVEARFSDGIVGHRPTFTDADDHTFALAEANQYGRYTGAGTHTWTIPANASVAFPTGTEIEIMNTGAGDLTLTAATGVTVNGVTAGSVTIPSYGAAVIKKAATDTWDYIGPDAAAWA